MKWKFKNQSNNSIICANTFWEPGEEKESSCPVPVFPGLVCTQEGDEPDPVLMCSDMPISDGIVAVNIPAPQFSNQLALSVFWLSGNGVKMSFNARENKKIIIDPARGFVQNMPWSSCSKLFFEPIGDGETLISINVMEVVSQNASYSG